MKTEEYSPLALAYIGDAHYALTVKRHVIDLEVKMDQMQRHTNKFVSARAQADIMEYLLAEKLLSEDESSDQLNARPS